MGRFFGRRPDPTTAIARALRRRFLEPGEEVLVGLWIQKPGTITAQSSGSASDAAIGASTGTFAWSGRSGKKEGEHWNDWAADAAVRHGLDARVARRTILVAAALTDSRLLLVRRSYLTRRPVELFASWPLGEIDRITVPRGGGLRIARGEAEMEFEAPVANKFLPDVYREFPERFARAKAEADAGSSDGPDGHDTAGP